jgi:uncharacterized protein (TIGR03435 family)
MRRSRPMKFRLVLVFAAAVTTTVSAQQTPVPTLRAQGDGVVLVAQGLTPVPTFSVVSIKRNTSETLPRTQMLPGGRYVVTAMAASVILRNAFGIGAENRIIGGPDWLFRDRYDVDARAEGVDRIPPGQLAPMLQHLLAERFNFRGRVEQRMLPVYALVEDRAGSAKAKLKATGVDCADQSAVDKARTTTAPGVLPLCALRSEGGGQTGALIGSGVSMERLARALSGAAGRTVINRTNIAGEFDVALEWSASLDAAVEQVSVFTVLRERLGLRLESAEAPFDVLVVERIDRPTAN